MKLVIFSSINKDSENAWLRKAIAPGSVTMVDPYGDTMCRIYFFKGKDTVVLGTFDEV